MQKVKRHLVRRLAGYLKMRIIIRLAYIRGYIEIGVVLRRVAESIAEVYVLKRWRRCSALQAVPSMEVLGTELLAVERSFRTLDNDRLDGLGIVWESCSSGRVMLNLAAYGLVYLEYVVAAVRSVSERPRLNVAYYEASRSVFPAHRYR